MKKLVAPLLTMLVLVAAAAVPAESSATPIKPALCEYKVCGTQPSALEFAEAYASIDFGGIGYGEVCEGPFGNGKMKETQWACYGHNSNGVHWQVNVSAYGEEEYATET